MIKSFIQYLYFMVNQLQFGKSLQKKYLSFLSSHNLFAKFNISLPQYNFTLLNRMKRIIISEDSLPSHLPEVLAVNILNHPTIRVEDLLTQLKTIFKNQASKIIGLRTYSSDYREDIRLSHRKFKLKNLCLPVELVVILAVDKYRITYNTQLSIDYFKFIRQIGAGTFSKVFLAEYQYDETLFIIKSINKKTMLDNGSKQQIKNQIQSHKIMKHHPWVTKLFYAFQDCSHIYLVMEFCPNGDLFSQLKNRTFTQKEALIIFTQAIWCLFLLRQNNIIYRDVKPQNFVVDNEGYLKITDFGFSMKLLPNQEIKGLCGSYEYMAPEMIQRKYYTYSYDVYALGILLFQILVGKTPFAGVQKQKIFSMNHIIQFPEFLSRQSVDLISQMTRINPSERLGAKNLKDIFSHSWFKQSIKIVNDVIERKVQSPFRQLTIQRQSSHQPEEGIQQQSWGIYYNYLQPPFNVEANKFGPKLKTGDDSSM